MPGVAPRGRAKYRRGHGLRFVLPGSGPACNPLRGPTQIGRRGDSLMLGWVLGILVWLFIAVLCAVMLLGAWTIIQKLWRK